MFCPVDDDVVELHVLGRRVDMLGTNCELCLSMVQCCFTSTETARLIRTESPGRPPRLSHSSWTLMISAFHSGRCSSDQGTPVFSQDFVSCVKPVLFRELLPKELFIYILSLD